MKDIFQKINDRRWDSLSERDSNMLYFVLDRINWWGRRIQMILNLAIALLAIIAYILIFGPPAWTSWFN